MSKITRPPLNIYCDESSHLENDRQPFLVLGAVKCPKDLARTVSEEIRAIKAAHGRKPHIEAKWTSISPANVNMYLALLDFFFTNVNLKARIVVAPKTGLDHTRFNQTFDDWYFKMYYQLLEKGVDREAENFIYLDMKDNRSAGKVAILREYLANRLQDFDGKIIKNLQVIRSHESELVQLADILIGAVNYANRANGTSEAKWQVVTSLRAHTKRDLLSSTAPAAEKFNLFHWRQRPRA